MIRPILSVPLLLVAACGAASGSSGGGMDNIAAAKQAGPGNLAAAGRYRLRGQPEAASEIVLHPDGRFQYVLAYGSLDQRAEGRWTSDGDTVILNTEPRPTPPAFSAGPVTRTAEHPISILVNAPDGQGIALIDVRVGLADGRVLEGYTQDYGWQPGTDEQVGEARWVELSALLYGIPIRRFELDPGAGNVFAFILTPNDLGVVDFRDTAAQITAEGLTVPIMGGAVRYARER